MGKILLEKDLAGLLKNESPDAGAFLLLILF